MPPICIPSGNRRGSPRKPPPWRAVWLVAGLLAWAPVHAQSAPAAPPQVVGYMLLGDRAMVALAIPPSHNGVWVQVGESTGGYQVVAIDPQRARVLVVNGRERWELAVHDTKITNGRAGLGRPEALVYYRNLIAAIGAAARNLKTYAPLPENMKLDGFPAGRREAILNSIKAVEAESGRALVVDAGDGQPLLLAEYPLDYGSSGLAFPDSLTAADKKELNAQSIQAKLEYVYASQRALQAAGLLSKAGQPATNHQLIVPPELKRTGS